MELITFCKVDGLISNDVECVTNCEHVSQTACVCLLKGNCEHQEKRQVEEQQTCECGDSYMIGTYGYNHIFEFGQCENCY